MMAQPKSFSQLTWDDQQQRYYETTYTNSQRTQNWMPVGWQPLQQHADPPKTPQSHTDSAYGSSPFTSPGQAATSPIAYNYNTQSSGPRLHPRTSSSGSADHRLPKGKGDDIYGYYNAKLGSTPENLHYETVDPSYYVRDRKFFQEGKVFAVIFSETAGSTATSYNSCLSEARFSGHLVYTQSRRFVVVRHKREFCFACPIFTYSGRATLKRGVRPAEHGIAYSEGQEPKLLLGETGIRKPSLAVAMAQGEPVLDIASRIYYGIHHPIQYNIKAKDIGHVLPHHVPTLIGNWKAEDDSETKQAAEVTVGAEQPELPRVPEQKHCDKKDGKRPIKRQAKSAHHVPDSPTSHKDPHMYHSKNNVYGYDSQINPHMYHPTHNPHGNHPKNNPHGYHPTSNPSSYHPEHNPHGHHPQKAPFCYHPQFSTFGYHGELNVHGYHPDVTPFNYHPESNPLGYHPEHNVYGYHPEKNPHGYHTLHHPYGYHPTHNPDAYHPTWKPQGHFYETAPGAVLAASQDEITHTSSGDEEEGGDSEGEDPPDVL